MRNTALRLLLLVLALSVQACGFTLRGNDAIVSSFDNLNPELAQPQSECLPYFSAACKPQASHVV